ncbi:MAG: hypothetical protein Q7S54_00410, partial [bacterium]|nr:hypothetical protein [bacterium]
CLTGPTTPIPVMAGIWSKEAGMRLPQAILTGVMLFVPFLLWASSDEPAVAKAEELLRREGYAELPLVRVVDASELAYLSETFRKEMELSTAFRIVIQDRENPAKDRLDPVIYIYRESGIYRLAEEGSEAGIALLAASIAHELVHENADDGEAYAAEASLLRKWIYTPGMSMEDRQTLAKFALVRREQSKKVRTHR